MTLRRAFPALFVATILVVLLVSLVTLWPHETPKSRCNLGYTEMDDGACVRIEVS